MTKILQGEAIPFEEQKLRSEVEDEFDSLLHPDGSSDSVSSTSEDCDDVEGKNATLKRIRALVTSKDSRRIRTSSEIIHNSDRGVMTCPPKTETQASMEAIEDIVSSLYRVATVIRRPAPADRHARSSEIDVQHFDAFDQQYVRDKFPSADPGLATRLAKGITRRRQLLKYRELHNRKLNLPKVDDSTEPKYRTRDEGQTSSQVSKSNVAESHFQPSTKATTFLPNVSLAMEETQSVAESTSSYQSTTFHHQIIQIPAKPRGSDGHELEEFECPYCYVLCRIPGRDAWK